MRHTKLIVFGIAIISAVTFGFLFWDDLTTNQHEIANMPVPPMTEFQDLINRPGDTMSPLDSYNAIDRDLDQTDVNGVDADSSSLEAELNAL